MDESRLSRGRDLAAWVGHAVSVAEVRPRENREIAWYQVRFLLEFVGCPKPTVQNNAKQREDRTLDVLLRPATEADLEFLISLRTETMAKYLEKNGLPTDRASHAQRIQYRFESANIVEVGDTPVGLFKYYLDSDHYTISQIQITPSHQGLGLGARLIEELLEKADSERKSVLLSVLRSNPAKGLYERLGFQIIGADKHEYTMEKTPNKVLKKEVQKTRVLARR